ncbi:hypothetical protein [Enterocloster citroniae]
MSVIKKQPTPTTPSDEIVKASFSSISLRTYSPESYDEGISGKGYVLWGNNNRFPDYLWNIYLSCSTLQSILNGYTDYTIGDDIINNTEFIGENQVEDTLQDVIRKIVLDRWVYGGFAFQIFYNKFGGVKELAYLDISRVRVNEDFTKGYVINDFKKYCRSTSLNKTIAIPLFGQLTQEERAKEGTEIFFYKGKKQRVIIQFVII